VLSSYYLKKSKQSGRRGIFGEYKTTGYEVITLHVYASSLLN